LENPLAAAELDDKAPAETPYDESLTHTGRSGGRINQSQARFRFDVAAYENDAERARAEVLYPSHGAFLAAARGETVPSVQTVTTYVKQLDDTIYAGVERALQAGVPPLLASKRAILKGALGYLVAHRSSDGDEALVLVAAALGLGASPAKGDGEAETIPVPDELAAEVDALRAAFVATPAEAKPQGFYGWSSDLIAIWQQDRLLQRLPARRGVSCALAEAIAADEGRKEQYLGLLASYSRLTNPLRSSLAELLPTAGQPACLQSNVPLAFLGRSATPEVALFERLYPEGVPAEADLMADLIKAIREGSVDLSPRADDGFYQHQLFALETLLVTDKSEERRKIAFMARYKKRLREAFSTMLVQHRETHVKQADVATVESAYVEERTTPYLRVEPMATVYVRHARSYVFLEHALDEVLGPTWLDQAFAVDAFGSTTSVTLRTRIHEARDRYFGLYVAACQDIGLPFALTQPGDPAPETWATLGDETAQWLRQLADDPVARSDVRVIVPIASLPENRAKYWAVVGVRATVAGYSYLKGADTSPPLAADMARAWLPTEQFLEVVSSATPLTRDELRALCDEQKTPDAIKKALEARR
jgi:hypothetical protein